MDKKKWCSMLYRNSKKRAQKNNMSFDISIEFLEKLWDKYGGACSLTGIKFSGDDFDSAARRPYAPSLDRINRRDGYVRKNVRIVCVAVNMALFTWGEGVFNEIVSARHLRMLEDAIPQKAQVEDIFLEPLLPRGRVEAFFGLKQGWFAVREKRGLPVPAPHDLKEYPSGARRFLYRTEDVACFFNENPASREWTP